MRRLSCLAGALASLCAVQPARAQERLVERPGFYLGLNLLIGGVSALTQSFLSPDVDPAEAFAKGALGGAVTWSGQRLAGTGGSALRLPGIQVAALGSNIARNAGRGVGTLSDVTLPLYPLYVRVRPGRDDTFSVRVSALAGVTLAAALLDANRFSAALDWKESLLTGAPVLRSSSSYIYPFTSATPPRTCLHGDPCAGAAGGLHRAGVTWYTTGGRTTRASRDIITHEIIHLTQTHRDALLHALPMSDGVLSHLGGPFTDAARFVVLDLYLPLMGLNQMLATSLPGSTRLYELEAVTMAGR